MQAVVIRAHGGREQLHLEELATPVPRRGEALVQIRAAALNRLDLFILQGLSGPGVRNPPLPHVPGADGAGIVTSLGPGVDGVVSIGDRVVAYPGWSCGLCEYCRDGEDSLCRNFRILGEDVWGVHADHAIIPVRSLLPVPADVPFERAAAAPVVYTTAWRMVVTAGQVRPGETVLVVGATGGVGTAAAQIAAMGGARVIAVSRGFAKADRLKASANVETLIPQDAQEWSSHVLDMTDGRGAHMVVDPVGSTTWEQSILSLAKGGRMVTCGATAGDRADFSIRELYQSHRRIIGAPLGSFQDFDEVMQLVFCGLLDPVIQAALPLARIKDAYELLARGEHVGKVILQMPSGPSQN